MPANIRKLESDSVRCELHLNGGHLAPVHFKLGPNNWVSPYSIPPWQPDEFPQQPRLLRLLRGDFFCFPFGETDGHTHPHGESANANWSVLGHNTESINCSLDTSEPTGTITKQIKLISGHRALYQTHTICGVDGHWNYGHHPILRIPDGEHGEIRTSPFKFASVYPHGFADPQSDERSALQQGALFEKLNRVPLEKGGYTSLEQYPAREGFEDLVMISFSQGLLAWSAVTFSNYVWISLRKVADFPSTLFWMSNGGRNQAPWLGRHRNRIGIEDVCSYFHEGAHRSRLDLLAAQDIPTSRRFHATTSTELRHLQFIHPVQEQSGLAELNTRTKGVVELIFENGSHAEAAINWQWLLGDNNPST